MINVSSIQHAPWNRGRWTGSWRTDDDTPAGDFQEVDVAKVIAYFQSPDDFDGTFGAIIQLHDGRYVSWEGWWGPTGSGFSEDAYGGNTDVWFSATLVAAIRALTERTMEDLWPQVIEDQPPAIQAIYRIGGCHSGVPSPGGRLIGWRCFRHGWAASRCINARDAPTGLGGTICQRRSPARCSRGWGLAMPEPPGRQHVAPPLSLTRQPLMLPMLPTALAETLPSPRTSPRRSYATAPPRWPAVFCAKG